MLLKCPFRKVTITYVRMYKGFCFIVCLMIVTFVLVVRLRLHTACLHQVIVSIYWVRLFVPLWLLVIGVSQTSLMVGVFRSKAFLVLWEEETNPSVVRFGRERLSCVIVGIQASGMSIPLSLFTDVKANPAIADVAGSSSKPLRYENLSMLERLSFECIALSKESQNSCHSSSFPLNFRTSSFGSFTLTVLEFAELEVAPFAMTFWFKGLQGDQLAFSLSLNPAGCGTVSFSSIAASLCSTSAFNLAARPWCLLRWIFHRLWVWHKFHHQGARSCQAILLGLYAT